MKQKASKVKTQPLVTLTCSFCQKEFNGTIEQNRIGDQNKKDVCPACMVIPKKPKIKQSFPASKLKAARIFLKCVLETYPAMKADLEKWDKDIDDEAAPKAVDIRDNIYTASKQIDFKGGFNTSVVIGHETHYGNDAMLSNANKLSQYRDRVYNGMEYKEMVRQVQAIERVMKRLERSGIPDFKVRAEMIKLKFFEQEKDDKQIAEELHIDQTTVWRWSQKTIKEIGKELGFVV